MNSKSGTRTTFPTVSSIFSTFFYLRITLNYRCNTQFSFKFQKLTPLTGTKAIQMENKLKKIAKERIKTKKRHIIQTKRENKGFHIYSSGGREVVAPKYEPVQNKFTPAVTLHVCNTCMKFTAVFRSLFPPENENFHHQTVLLYQCFNVKNEFKKW